MSIYWIKKPLKCYFLFTVQYWISVCHCEYQCIDRDIYNKPALSLVESKNVEKIRQNSNTIVGNNWFYKEVECKIIWEVQHQLWLLYVLTTVQIVSVLFLIVFKGPCLQKIFSIFTHKQYVYIFILISFLLLQFKRKSSAQKWWSPCLVFRPSTIARIKM